MDALVAKMDHFLTKQAISKYETGKSVPGSDVLVRVAEVLGVKHGKNVTLLVRAVRGGSP